MVLVLFLEDIFIIAIFDYIFKCKVREVKNIL